MKPITLLVGSTLGAAEDLAEEIAEILQANSYHPVIHTSPQVDHILIKPSPLLLLICSTHGAGDLPENIQPFYNDLLKQAPDLSAVSYLAIGLGDTSYEDFCQAIVTLDLQLNKLGAKRLADPLKIDVSRADPPEVIAKTWLDRWLAQQ
ncbi:flavodoxin domain-containing protein [Oceanisphaera avium]|uniref:FMN-binding protein MioC n=1 Tax=Oceanisphaera avium TaxID=1903694 RepID=A0A1Y0CZQ5_9GAMM|nr:flavodoxin domain-containing protein [Oceanisphaera avium]ART80474.1 FMN-binding protein MioC [Oceanisphaera avium]